MGSRALSAGTLACVFVGTFACTFDSSGFGQPLVDDGSSSVTMGSVDTTGTVDDGSATGVSSTGIDPATTSSSTPVTTAGETTGDGADQGLVEPCDTAPACPAGEVCVADPGGTAACVCAPGTFRGAGTCEPVTLDPARVELACDREANECQGFNVCPIAAEALTTSTLTGDADTIYEARVRVRGVIETRAYDGEGRQGFWHEDAVVAPSSGSEFALDVSDPASTVQLNSEPSPPNFAQPIDYEESVLIRGGAELTLRANRGTDPCGRSNGDAQGVGILIPDVPPLDEPFDGQFLQIDLVAVTEGHR